MPAGAEVTYSVRCGGSGNDTVIVNSAPRRATASLLVSDVRWLNERDQSFNTEHPFRCGSAPMGDFEVSINLNVVKTMSNSSFTPLGTGPMNRTEHRRYDAASRPPAPADEGRSACRKTTSSAS